MAQGQDQEEARPGETQSPRLNRLVIGPEGKELHSPRAQQSKYNLRLTNSANNYIGLRCSEADTHALSKSIRLKHENQHSLSGNKI